MLFDAATNRERRIRRMRRGVVTSGELHRDMGRAVVAMITLTYRPDVAWRPEHISAALQNWRRELGGRPLRYVWVMELTKRGVPHYHVLVWLPGGARLEKPDQSGAWPHGWSRIELARNAVGYLVKYATKGTDGYSIPRGARLFGVGGLDAARRRVRSWHMLPRYVRTQCSPSDRVRRARGGGWLSPVSGEFWRAWAECSVEAEFGGERLTFWAEKGTVAIGCLATGALFMHEEQARRLMAYLWTEAQAYLGPEINSGKITELRLAFENERR